MENASTELHGWKTQVRKTQVQICRGGKRKYRNGKSDLNPEVTEKYHCQSTGYIEGDIFVEVKQHTQHQSMAEEIQCLQLLERCRKRPTEPLRRIFDTETQSTGNAAGASVAFVDIESSMYKRRRRELPILPIQTLMMLLRK